MSALHDPGLYRFNLDEFLLIEAQSEGRLEMFDGYIYAMSGASPNHEQIVSNLFGDLWIALRHTDCRVYGSNLKFRDRPGESVCVPDLSVVCGGFKLDPGRPDLVTNPTVVIEVLSPSTARKDASLKLAAYQRMASLREYVLVTQDKRRIEVLSRKDGGDWTSRVAEEAGQSVGIPSIDHTLYVDDAYARVTSVASPDEEPIGSPES